MQFEELGYDIFVHVFLMLGNSPYGYIQRLKCRSVCRTFNEIDTVLFSDSRACLKIPRDIANFGYYMKPDLILFDLDDMTWVRSADLCFMHNCIIKINPRVIFNPITHKFSYWNCKLKQWVQKLQLIDHMGNMKPLTILPPKIPTEILHMETLGKRALARKADQNTSVNSHSKFMYTMCRDLKSSTNLNIVSLSLTDSNCCTDDFKLLSTVLLDTQIVKLNLSGHMCDESLEMGSVFLNAKKIEHLNINFCGNLSQFDRAALIHLLLTSTKLRILKTFFTSVLYDVIQYLKICSSISQLEELSLSLTKDIAHFGISDKSVTSKFLHVTTPNNDVMITIDQTSLSQKFEFLSSFELCTIEKFVAVSIPLTFLRNVDAKTKKKVRYAKRNEYRNQLTKEDRVCQSCKFVWPAGSLKIQTFEGRQSICKLKNKLCINSHTAKMLLKEEDSISVVSRF